MPMNENEMQGAQSDLFGLCRIKLKALELAIQSTGPCRNPDTVVLVASVFEKFLRQ